MSPELFLVVQVISVACLTFCFAAMLDGGVIALIIGLAAGVWFFAMPFYAMFGYYDRGLLDVQNLWYLLYYAVGIFWTFGFLLAECE